jgi:hypothetical protein
MKFRPPMLLRVYGTLLLTMLSGCAATPYRYGTAQLYRTSPELEPLTATQIERGRPVPFLDGLGWVIGIPNKILLWNSRIENHDVSPETEEAIAEYLAKNDLGTVKVRLNQYAPGDDWHRLVANKSVGWGWRYSLGTLSWLGETVFPGRVIGGDHYNPFTNTVHIYSDIPAVAVHEGGHAKDFARRRYKGTYAAVYLLPVVPLWHEAKATNDALGYFQAEGDVCNELEAYRVLYPAYGTYVGSAVGDFVPGARFPLYLAGVAGGHVVGRVKAWRVGKEEPVVEQARYERADAAE